MNDKKPNIVYILTDDMGYGDISCYGQGKIQTPNLDRLAKEGIMFSDAHSNSAVCTPTRYGILTGRYCWRSPLKKGVLWGHSEPLIETDRMTVPSYLKQHGYDTACIGKWHLGLGWAKNGEDVDYCKPISHGPVNVGFDYYFGISASLDMPPYCFIENDRTVGIPSMPKEPVDFSQAGRTGMMVPGWKDEAVNQTHTEKAVKYIVGHTEKTPEKPFFLYLALTGPHTPWSPAEPFKNQSGIGPRGDLVMEMDWTVGQIMETLDQLNLRDNTLLIFTSDNGPHPKTDEVTVYGHKPAGDFRGQKADIWDGGHRIPFIASWPDRIRQGRLSNELICLTDLFATCAAILGDNLPEDAAEDSIDILPILLENQTEKPGRESVIHHSLNGMFAIRKGEWKFIEGVGSGGFGPGHASRPIGIPEQGLYEPDGAPGQLYHMEDDFSEKQNLYLQRMDIVDQLTKELTEIQNRGHRYL